MKASNNQLIRMMQQQFYEEMKAEFLSLGEGGHYTNLQKEYAFRTIQEYGIRATSRILSVPRRTLQRWCRLYNVYVKRVLPGFMNGPKGGEKSVSFGDARGIFK